ncbi:MAG: 30S ribosomal protein S5 [Candidatus Aenigmarchaeota archaeon]|nr:30S ribosomal protein S5 [Candidatus Aenigmarchaeota archaeon]NIQ18097.1 30S ribosomal protein S5 [Candidatus Aenigmarchaeota archaeon]
MTQKKRTKHEETRKEIEKEKEVVEEKKEVEEKTDKKTEKKIERQIARGKKTKEEVTEKAKKETREEKGPRRRDVRRREEEIAEWVPKTRLGNEVLKGEYKSLEDLLEKGEIILEPEVVDYLVPEIKQELIYIGGTPGKGGGARRTPTKMTARMHKSGRRFKLNAVMVVGNEDGIVGIGKSVSNEHRVAIEKALQQAKLNVIKVRRGCGSWECNCGGDHSIPFKIEGKVGSVKVVLLPTPTGVGIVAGDETKKVIRLAGIRDVWVKTYGMTSTRGNLAFAVVEALKNLSRTKGDM